MKKILLLLLLCNFNLYAYFIMNGRNHPELDWKQLETEHIVIVYHPPLYEYALESARIAEATYESLCKTYDLTPKSKIKIYISDQDQITNGYSMAGDHIAIWVNQNDFVNIFTGKEKWLRKVIAHEMSHHFLFLSVSGWLDNFFPLSSMTFPSHINEGYAMFFSGEEWGYNREDANLRRAVFSNKTEGYKGGYNYTIGFSMVRYLYEFYGEQKLRDLLKYRNKIDLYSFKDAFQEVYGEKFDSFKEEWRQYIFTYYFGSAYKIKAESGDDTSMAYTLNALEKTSLPWHEIRSMKVKSDSLGIIYGKKHKKQNYYDLSFVKISPDSLKKGELYFNESILIEKNNRISDFDLSSNGKYSCFSRYTRYEHGGLFKTLYLFDIGNKKKIKTIPGSMGQVKNNGDIFYQLLNHTANYVRIRNLDGETEDFLQFDKKSQIGNLCLSPEEDKLLVTRYDEYKQFLVEIFDIKSKKCIHSKKWQRMVLHTLWLNNDEVMISIESCKDSRTEIWNLNPDGEWLRYYTPPFNIEPICSIQDSADSFLTFGELDRANRTLGKISIKPIEKTDADTLETGGFFSRWIDVKYPNQISVADTMPEIKLDKKYNAIAQIKPFMLIGYPVDTGLLFTGLFMEPLFKHTLLFYLYSPYNFEVDNMWMDFTYLNHTFEPEIQFSYMQYEWFGGMWQGEPFYQKIKNGGVSFRFPVNFLSEPFRWLNYGLGLNYQKVKMNETDFDTQPIFEDGSAITASLFWDFSYNLPYQNQILHPVRKFSFSNAFTGASDKMKMKKDFTNYVYKMEFGFAPLYNLFKDFSSDILTIRHASYFEVQNGDYLPQNQPGIDENRNVPISGEFLTNRRYLRGYDETRIGDKLLITKNELWVKILDDTKISLNVGAPIFKIGYTGIGAWSDYSKLWQGNNSFEYQAAGWEIKSLVEILQMPIILRYGSAYDIHGESLENYFQADIPLLENLQSIGL